MPGLPEKAAAEGLSALAYMRKYGVVEIAKDLYRQDERPLTPEELDGAVADEHGVLRKPTDDDSTPPLVGEAGSVGVQLGDGSRVAGWLTPSRKLELYSDTAASFGWPEHATPGYIRSHVAASEIDDAAGEMVLVPTFRLPTLIHTRSGNAKYLNEISNTHPLWMNADDARAKGLRDRRRWFASLPGSATSSRGSGPLRASVPESSPSATTWGDGGCTTTTAAGG